MNAAQKHQLEMLKRKQAESPTTFWFLALVALGSGIGALITHDVIFIMLFLLSIVLGLGSIETVKLLRQAICAIIFWKALNILFF